MSLLTVQNLTKKYEQTPVVNKLSFELQKDSCIALLGQNGAGKTTTLKMLSGLIKPTSGSIQFQHQKYGKQQKQDIRSQIGYLPQFPVFYEWMTGEEFLIYVGKLAHFSNQEAKQRTQELLERVGLTEAATQRIEKYSGGMKQRLGIAQALIHRPKLVMLDEPVSALDPIGRREVLQLLKQLKEQATILFSTHVLHDAEEVSDQLIIIDRGSLKFSGTLTDIQERFQEKTIVIEARSDLKQELEKWKRERLIIDFLSDGVTNKIFVENLDTAVPLLLQAIIDAKIQLTRFEAAKMSLEDLFLKVVQSA